jgi:hypothetical protein
MIVFVCAGQVWENMVKDPSEVVETRHGETPSLFDTLDSLLIVSDDLLLLLLLLPCAAAL